MDKGRAAAVVEQAVRSRILTRDFIRAEFGFETLNAVSQYTSRLSKVRWLNRYTHGRLRYYTPGRRAVRKFQLLRSAQKPVPPQLLLQDFGAMLWTKHRLTPSELLGHFPWLPKHLLRAPFYLEKTAPTVLVRISVEMASPYHVIRKHRMQLRRLQTEQPEFARLCDDGRFMIVLITATAEACQALKDQLDRNAPHFPPVRLGSYPKLLEFFPTGGRRHASA